MGSTEMLILSHIWWKYKNKKDTGMLKWQGNGDWRAGVLLGCGRSIILSHPAAVWGVTWHHPQTRMTEAGIRATFDNISVYSNYNHESVQTELCSSLIKGEKKSLLSLLYRYWCCSQRPVKVWRSSAADSLLLWTAAVMCCSLYTTSQIFFFPPSAQLQQQESTRKGRKAEEVQNRWEWNVLSSACNLCTDRLEAEKYGFKEIIMLFRTWVVKKHERYFIKLIILLKGKLNYQELEYKKARTINYFSKLSPVQMLCFCNV